MENSNSGLPSARAAPQMNWIQWKQGPSADMGVSHSSHWPPEPAVSSQAPAQAALKDLTKKKNPKMFQRPEIKARCSRSRCLKCAVSSRQDSKACWCCYLLIVELRKAWRTFLFSFLFEEIGAVLTKKILQFVSNLNHTKSVLWYYGQQHSPGIGIKQCK